MAAKDMAGRDDLRLGLEAPPVVFVGDQADGKVAKPEKQLNVFVRVVTLMERVGNALGTLAFTWATVVLLGGYPTVLGKYDDFWFATTIVFLEAVRMFMSRNNRLDYQLFFRTKGAVRPLGKNGLIVTVYLCSILMYCRLIQFVVVPRLRMLMPTLSLIIPAVYGLFHSSGALNLLSRSLRHAISLCSPLVATMLPVPFLVTFNHYYPKNIRRATWTVFIILFSVVLLLTISRLRFKRVIKLVEHAMGTNATKQVFWRQVVLNICMFVELVMLLVLMPGSPRRQLWGFAYSLYALVLVSFGNLQIPAAIVRVTLSLMSLMPHDYNEEDDGDSDAKTNLAPSLTVFYVMVLGQGILYIVACLLEIFSFIPRRALARRGGLRGQWGVQTVNLYYAYALEKCMEKDVLAPKEMSLSSFAMNSINSDSPKKQLHGVQMMHNLLHREPARMQLLSKLDASTKMMSRLVGMLGWTRPEYRVIRLFAAKVIAELAKSLRVAMVPGMLQLVSSLLDTDRILEREHTLLDTDDEEEQKQDILVTNVRYIQQERHVLLLDPDGNQNQRKRLNPLWDTISSSLGTEAHATHQVGMDKHNSCLVGCFKWMSTLWSTSYKETETPTHEDYLPALGMSILDNLCCDQDNYVEITRQADLIPKIIEFTSYKNYTKNINKEQQKTLMRSSLKLLKRMSKTDGEIGMTLRHKISEHPLLLMNLAEILDDRFSSQGVRKLVIGILRNLALDADISQEIGRIQVITGRLMDAFLKQAAPSSKSSNQCLRKVAGQALAMLTMESADNCKAMTMEAGNVIGELTRMICENNKKSVAARLLVNLVHHMQPDLSNLDLMKLCEVLPKVLDTILDAETEGAELEVMIGLSSQMCKVVPEYFAQELENGHRKEMFVKRLVDVLKANMKLSIHYPGMRRVTIEQAIYLMTCCSSCYANGFNEYSMMEALLMVERTPSRVERYRMFLGNTGIMEQKQSLTDLVAAAKTLLCHQ